MRILRNPVWLISAALFLTHQLLQYGAGVSLPVADAYLDPLAGTVAALGLLEVERRWLFGVRQIAVLDVIISCLGLAVISEWLFPRLSGRFYADWTDVLLIGLGGVIYWFGVREGEAAKGG